MKKIVVTLFFITASLTTYSQDFNKFLTEARSSYSTKKLSDSRFAMEQMLKDLDMAIGKDILKLLPAKMDALAANTKEDNVTSTGASVTGLFVQRTYGTDKKKATVEIVNNSPLITSLNAFLSMPLVGLATSSDATQKVVKVQGYKGILNKNADTESGKVNYELQIPMNNTLVSFRLDDATEADVTRLAATIPLAKIAEMAQ